MARAVDMDRLELALEDADEVDHRVAALDRAPHLIGVAYVGGDELGLAEPAQRLEEIGLARVALRDSDARAGLVERLGDIAADETAAAEKCDQPVH